MSEAVANDKRARTVMVLTFESFNKDGEWWGPQGFNGRNDDLVERLQRLISSFLGVPVDGVRVKTYYDWNDGRKGPRIVVLPSETDVLT